VAAGLIAGNRPDALPAPMSELDPMSELAAPFRSGSGPSGTVVLPAVVLPAVVLPAVVLPDDVVADAAGVAVTATVSCAAGGVHVAVVVMPAVAVSVTELTEVAPAATGIWASRLTALVSVTVPTAHAAALPPWAQPLVNAGGWLDGVEFSVTDTPAAEPFLAETVTTNAASCPRWTLACAVWTLTQSSAWAAVALGLAVT
jgi:hypothetical protein